MKVKFIPLFFMFAAGCSSNYFLPSEAVTFNANAHFSKDNLSGESFYFDKYRKVLAINAGDVNLRDKYIQSTMVLGKDFVKGEYSIELSTITEVDGESSYKVLVNNRLISKVINPETTLDFEPVQHKIGVSKLKAGDIIVVAAKAVTNGNIPEGDETAYARGRW